MVGEPRNWWNLPISTGKIVSSQPGWLLPLHCYLGIVSYAHSGNNQPKKLQLIGLEYFLMADCCSHTQSLAGYHQLHHLQPCLVPAIEFLIKWLDPAMVVTLSPSLRLAGGARLPLFGTEVEERSSLLRSCAWWSAADTPAQRGSCFWSQFTNKIFNGA